MYFPSNFSVCGVGLVRNSVDELFVEGTCNVFGVDVCVVFESYGVCCPDNIVHHLKVYSCIECNPACM